MKECKKACHLCGELMTISQAFVEARVSHLACAMEDMKEMRAKIAAMDLDKAKEHVNRECPH